ncbi:MAG: dephospho-CoA kinase [Chloroflexota bacterium]
MSAWPGKYVVGLTGNIATGKSVVRKMLEHLGAYGIDADALSHRAIAKDAPGYKMVVDRFGKWILAEDGQIDRNKLGRVVFADPEALAELEAIVHPLVRQAVDVLVRRSTQKVIVIEAIKLIESPLRQACDSLWVADAAPEVQVARLVQKRQMTEAAARQRIQAQAPQQEKLAAANVVIKNDGSFNDTWKQVSAAWEKFQSPEPVTTPIKKIAPAGEFAVERARPRQAEDIAGLITRLSEGKRQVSADDVMEAFGEKAYLLLKVSDKPVGLVGWQVENLVARTDDLYIETNVPLDKALQAMMEEVERASKDLQCEALLLFLPPQLAQHGPVWRHLGYESRSVQNLGVRAWQEAAQESMPEGYTMLFKQLRKDRVLRPV